ncbi:MAG: S24 family peptidase [Fimbriimonadaceae bacterium]|nr:S24 family peptidase [Fimbriimonadaceae bacterium]
MDERISVGTKVRKLGRALGLKGVELAEGLGLDRTTVYTYGRRPNANPAPAAVDRLIAWLAKNGKPVPDRGWFYDGRDTDPSFVEARSTSGRPVQSLPMVPVRVVGRVGAGPGENDEADYEPIYVPANLGTGADRIAHLIEGDSMMPALEPGDVAVFRETRRPMGRRAFLLKSPDGRYQVKRVVWEQDRFVGRSLNPRYEDVPLDDYQIEGMLVGFYRSVGGYERIEYDFSGLVFE